MPISVTCQACGQKLKAKDTLAGRLVRCPKCAEQIRIPIPEAVEEIPAAVLLDPEEPPEPPEPPMPPAAVEDENSEGDEEKPAARRKRKKLDVASLPPLSTNEPPLWLRHLHWLLILALLPLAFSLLQSCRDDFLSRLKETLDQAAPKQQERILQVLQNLNAGKASEDEFFDALPNQKLAGAFLPRYTWIHWLFALAATALFMTFFLVLSRHHTANAWHLLAMGSFTATVGIAFLLGVQLLANLSHGVWIRGGGRLAIFFFIIKLIGFSYQAALNPENGFLLSFVGYTLGVGFCEEVVKAIPLLAAYRRPSDQSWRGAFLWGLASGAGFGISEGIMYSGSFYNGIHGPGIYVVRFISCVALHALWTGSVGITLNQRQWPIQGQMTWYEFIPPLLAIVAVPMVLHGLYDTLLKKEMNALALVVAVLSFLFLAFQISRLHGVDDKEATKAMLKEYKRRRKSMA